MLGEAVLDPALRECQNCLTLTVPLCGAEPGAPCRQGLLQVGIPLVAAGGSQQCLGLMSIQGCMALRQAGGGSAIGQKHFALPDLAALSPLA